MYMLFLLTTYYKSTAVVFFFSNLNQNKITEETDSTVYKPCSDLVVDSFLSDFYINVQYKSLHTIHVYKQIATYTSIK